ncbi:alginate export family protein [Motiliproteus sediminis]|uniref:alginate export family protein n=1 Tax=Motiliproteus sediminis TaxID=1468178 RepID=UPI001AEFB921|nr:alginate export family protein [Motiliproteus sediminis]
MADRSGYQRGGERALLLAGWFWASMAIADGVAFDIDDPPSPDHRLADNLNGGAKLVVESEYRDDHDLDRHRDDRRISLEPQLEAVLAWAPAADAGVVAELELRQKYWPDHPDGRRSDDAVLELKELYLWLREFAPGWSVQLGRQRYRDRREWLYDEELDGIRLLYRRDSWGLELSATREEAFDRDLFNSDDETPIDNYELRLRQRLAEDRDLDLYWLRRDEREADGEDLDFVGIHSSGRASSHHYYWLEAAVVSGERRGRDILGYGVDLGWSYRFSGAQRHNLTLGVAYGSGDNDGSGTDNNFRQTGLQDNNAKLQGVTKVKIYGELLEPELSNLVIATLGWGMRTSEDSSIDLLYHRYRQVEADDDLRDSNLLDDPNGDSRDIGEAVDLVWAGRLAKDLKLSWALGTFKPGRAYDRRDRAWFSELSLNLRF